MKELTDKRCTNKGNPNWVKGESPNPAGRPPSPNLEKEQNRCKALLTHNIASMTQEVIDIFFKAKTNAQLKYTIWKECSDRVLGKVPKAIEVKNDGAANPINLLASMGQMFINKLQSSTIEGEVVENVVDVEPEADDIETHS
jgi:hypothetical protein